MPFTASVRKANSLMIFGRGKDQDVQLKYMKELQWNYEQFLPVSASHVDSPEIQPLTSPQDSSRT